MFGNEFKSIDKLFGDAKVRDWDIDEFYVAILSLTEQELHQNEWFCIHMQSKLPELI